MSILEPSSALLEYLPTRELNLFELVWFNYRM
jgi:hypothetical protein